MFSLKVLIKKLLSTSLSAVLLFTAVLPVQTVNATEATVVIASPSDNQTISTNANNTVQVTGYVNNVYPDGLKIVAYLVGQTPGQGTQVNYEANGSFATTVDLSTGDNIIEVWGTGPAGTEMKSVTVKYETGAPIISLNNLTSDYLTVTSSPYVLTGTVSNGVIQSITLNGQHAGSQLPCTLTNLALGLNRVTITARNNTSGKTTTKDLYITYDNAPNVLNLTPTNNSIVDNPSQTITGTVVNYTKVQVSINNGTYIDVPVVSGALNYPITLSQQGNNQIVFKVYNNSRVTTKVLTLTYYNGDPYLYDVNPGSTSVYSPSVNIKGAVLYADRVEVAGPAGTTVNAVSDRFFDINVTGLLPGSNTVAVTAYRGSIPSSTATVNITYLDAPQITLTGALNYVTSTDVTKNVYWNDTLITLTGNAQNTATNTVDISQDGVTTPVNLSSGNFNKALRLKDGLNVVKISARSSTNLVTQLTLNIEYKFNSQPTIKILQPTNATQDIHINEPKVKVEGQALNVKYLTMQLNGGNFETINFDSQGKFTREISLVGGLNTINFKGQNNTSVTTVPLRVYFDQIPVITVTTPKAGAEIKTNTVVVSGTVKYCDTDGLTINGEKVSFSSSTGSFSKEIRIDPDKSQVIVKAKRGQVETTQTVNITYKGTPEIVFSRPTDKSQVYSSVINIRGQIQGVAGALDTTEVKVNNKTVMADVYGNFSLNTTLKLGSNTITASAKLANKKTLTKSIKVTYVDLAMIGAEVETTVPANGATIKLFEGDFELKVPKNGFSTETTLTAEIEEGDDFEKNTENTLYVGNIFEIRGRDPEKPLTLTLKYVKGIKDVQASNIGIYKYNHEDEEWVPIGGKVDAKKGTVTQEIDKLGTYTVMAYIKTFNDTRGHWAQKDIEILLAKGISGGRSGNYFAPDEDITRAEFVKMLVKASAVPLYKETEPSFYDVDEDHWAFDYVQAAVRVGIAKGASSGRFAPDKKITRAEAATMVARAANLKATSDQNSLELLNGFKDKNQIAAYAQGPVSEVVKAGLFKGMTDGTFRPGARTTRAQTAKMLVRLMSLERRL